MSIGALSSKYGKFFVDIGLTLASRIHESQAKFYQYLNQHQTSIGEANLIDDELKKSLYQNKRFRYDSIPVNVIIKTEGFLLNGKQLITYCDKQSKYGNYFIGSSSRWDFGMFIISIFHE